MQERSSTFALIEDARAGDREALSLLFALNRRRLEVLIYFKLSTGARRVCELEDIRQETMLRAFRDLASFRYTSAGSFMRWLSSIADHVIVDRMRYLSRDRRAGDEVPFRSESNPLGPEPIDSKTPSRIFSNQEEIDLLVQRIHALPEDYRQAIVLAKLEGLSTGEIAEAMGKSREAVALLVYRAAKRLRAMASGTGV